MNNIFYTSLDIRSIEPIDKRFYIDELTVENLTILFGSNGQYAISNAFLFNRTDKKFYYFTSDVVPTPNILNPDNWSIYQVSANGKFVEWGNDISYEIGSSVYDPNTIPTGIKFYVAKDTTTIGEAPYLTPEEWLEIGSSASTRQTALVTIDTAQTTQTFNVVYTDITLPSLPQIAIFAKYLNGGSTKYVSIHANYSIDATTKTISFTMTGDLTDILNESENIRVIIS